MVEKQKARLEKALGNVLEDLDRTHLRHLQAEMHRCAAKCCENTADTIEQNYRCIEKCSAKSDQAEEYVVTEFFSFLNQLQKCADSCTNDMNHKIGSKSTSEKIMKKYRNEMENCVAACVEKHIEIIPDFVKHVKEDLAK